MIKPQEYMLGGNATFTLQSEKTGQHFTYRIRQPKPTTPHFVQVLTGSDNESSYTFFGTIFDGKTFRTSKNSRISANALSVKTFAWMMKHVDSLAALGCKFIPSGKCCRCGRKLTTPESVEHGIGPECIKYQR